MKSEVEIAVNQIHEIISEVLFGRMTPKDAEDKCARIVSHLSIECYRQGKNFKDSGKDIKEEYGIGFQ